MTTPLKALIQERLRAKIVRQEVDDENDDSDAEDNEDDERKNGGPRMHSRRTMQVRVHAPQHHHHRRHASDERDAMLMGQYRSIPTPTHHEYASNQRLMDYYYGYNDPLQQQEVTNEGRGEFRRRHGSGRNAYDEKRFYDEEDEHRSPLLSPWRQPQVEGGGKHSFDCRGGSNTVLKSPCGSHQQHRVHPADPDSFPSRSLTERTQYHRGQETRLHGRSLDYDTPSNQQHSEHHQNKHRNPRGYFASQLYLDSKQQKSHDYQPHRRHQHGFGDEGHARQQNESPDLSPQAEKYGYGTFDDPYEMMEDTYGESHSGRRHEHKNRSEQYTRHKAPQDEEGNRHHASRRVASPSARITNPLAAASQISSMVPSREPAVPASSSPVEASHRYTGQPYRSSTLPIPTPLDMAVIDPPRRSESTSQVTSNSSSNNIASSNKYVRRVDSMLSPACHLAAKAFVAKRQKRSTNSTPRTMATKRWLQSFDNPDCIDMDASPKQQLQQQQ
uniref:Uncharacterized protein n=1 Tax=Globisporangium ultimum (strain ATCC 200006 / CBS 805.95 / DAOM BR144) TaxID=431595 RepID=K3W4Z6_GLOUD